MSQDNTSTVLQGQFLPDYQEKFLKDLLASTSTLGGEGGPYVPAYESYIAGLTPAQQQAINLGTSGVGSYLPMMRAGQATLGQGIGGYQQGMNYALSGVPLFQEAARRTTGALGGAAPFQQQAAQALRQSMGGARDLGMQAGGGYNPRTGLFVQGLGQRGGQALAGLGQQAQRFGIGQQRALQGIGQQAQRQLAGLGAQAGGIGAGAAQDILGARGTVAGSTLGYDPRSVGAFMDPYTEQVIQRAEADIARQGGQQAQDIRARAVGAGAFGGSREAIAQRELGRNVAEQQARTAAQLRSQGYQQAQQQAQTAFESQQRRQQQAGQLFGQLGQMAGQMGLAGLGQQIGATQAGQQQRLAAQQAGAGLGMQGLQQAMAGQQAGTGLGLQGLQQGMAGQQLAGRLGQGLGQLGTSFGALGLQGAGQLGSLGAQYGSLGQGLGQLAGGLGRLGLSQAALGETLQGAQQRDINALMGLGGLEQQYNQRLLDAQRRTLVEREAAPYQSLGFMSDIFRGVPTTTSSLTASTAPSPSMISQIGGLGLGLAGLGQSGLFDGLFGRSQ
jgi:hypothetical protein